MATTPASPPKDSDDPDFGALFLSRVQVYDALKALRECEATFALLHHPPESGWFHPSELPLHREQLSQFDFVLRGHEHVPDAFAMSRGTERPTHRLAAGALHEYARRKKSFVMGSLDLRQSVATVFFWAFQHEKWDADTEAGRRRGCTKFALPRRIGR